MLTINSLRKIFLQKSDNFRAEYRNTDELPAIVSCKPNWRSIFYECGLMYHCIHPYRDGVYNKVPRQLRIYISIALLWRNPVKRNSMLIFLSSCLNFKYGVKIHEHVNYVRNVVFWCGLGFFPYRSHGVQWPVQLKVWFHSQRDFSPLQPQVSVSPQLCLHYCLCAQAVPRQALASVQRPEEEQAIQSGNVGQFTQKRAWNWSWGCYVQGSYWNIDFWLSNPISIFYITCIINYIF